MGAPTAQTLQVNPHRDSLRFKRTWLCCSCNLDSQWGAKYSTLAASLQNHPPQKSASTQISTQGRTQNSEKGFCKERYGLATKATPYR
eukprot:2416903-Amphidinium_carterae.1